MTSIGIDVDCRDGFVYWSDVTTKTIVKADFSGRRQSTVVTSDLISPEGNVWFSVSNLIADFVLVLPVFNCH